MHTKLWSNLIYTLPISNDGKWKFYLEPQLRFIDNPHKFEAVNLNIATYYQLIPNLSVWLGGFTGVGRTTNGNPFQEYRAWEQIQWRVIKNEHIGLYSRTRLEERKRKDFKQMADRLREKLQLEFPLQHAQKCFITLADEGFFNLNKPAWVVNRLFAQNRASIGVRLPLGKKSAYEVGYLNQYEYGNTQNNSSNVVYFNIFADNPSSQNVQNE